MTKAAALLFVLTACASAAPPPAPAPPAAVVEATPSAPSAPVPATAPAAPAPSAPITPGSVAIGDILGPPHFDAKTPLAAMKPGILKCYTATRSFTPDLHGKLVLKLHVTEEGVVDKTEAQPGGTANDPGLVACIADAAKSVTFPRPGGTATITVPLVFRQ